MTIWQDGLIALLATVGLAAIIWLPIRAVCLLPEINRRIVAVLCVQDDCVDLEQQVRALLHLTKECGISAKLLLVDCGLSEEGRGICRLICRLHPQVTLCDRHEIESLITQGELP